MNLFFILLGFVSAFSVTSWTPVPLIIGFFLTAHLALNLSLNKRIRIPWSDKKIPVILFLLFIIVGISFMSQNYDIGFNSKGSNHLLSYYVSILIYFVVISIYLYHFSIPIDKIFKSITAGVILVSVLTILEFIFKNFTSLPYDSFIYRANVKDYHALYHMGSSFVMRSRGVAEESGPDAMYLLMFYPFLVYYFSILMPSKRKLLLSSLLVIIAVFVTFSAVGIFEMIVASLIAYLFYFFKYKKARLNMLVVIFLCFAMALLVLFIPKDLHLPSSIMDKLTFSEDSVSAQSRLGRWSFALDMIGEKPFFGYGPGIAAILNGTGSTSLYIEFLVEFGFAGLSVLVIFMFYYLRLIFKIQGVIKYVYFFSFIVATIHYGVISSYWFPWLWVLFAVVQATVSKQNVSVPNNIHSKIGIARFNSTKLQ